MTDNDDPRAHEYLDAYRTQLRPRMIVHDPGNETVERVGPVRRLTKTQGRGFVMYRDLGGLAGAELDAFIAQQREHFAGLGRTVEWKYHLDDEPADLPRRLREAGFAPEDDIDRIVVGEAADHVIADRLPEGVTVREVTSLTDLERIRVMHEAVSGRDFSWLPPMLSAELANSPDPLSVFVAETAEEVVCAGWIRLHTGTEFTSLWGGSTLPAWRGKGIYKALVRRRAQLAVARGYKYLQFDCSDESMPILRRMGMLWVATAHPHVWTPPASA